MLNLRNVEFLLALSLIVFFVGCSQENSVPGNIEGFIRDSNGNPLGGVVVLIVEGDAPFPEMAAITDEEGHFMLMSVPSGAFVVGVNDRQGSRIGQERVMVEGGMTSEMDILISTRGVYTIKTLSAECGSGDIGGFEESIVSVDKGLLKLVEYFETPTPCYEVTGNVSVVGNDIVVNLGLLPTSDICIECIGLVVGEIKVHNLEKGEYKLKVKTPKGESTKSIHVE